MLILYETPAGYSLFKVSNDAALKKTSAEEIYDAFFETTEKARRAMELVRFQPFNDTAEAVGAATSLMEGSVPKPLKSFLKKQMKKQQQQHKQHHKKGGGTTATVPTLGVADVALGSSLKDELGGLVTIAHDNKTSELFRGIRCHLEDLLSSSSSSGGGGDGDDDDDDNRNGATSVSGNDLRAMQLGLSHSLGRYKLKFSADKVDTMVIQAVGLLDELDKEINTYAMRVKEWYGWHFPELQSLVGDNAKYSRLVLLCGMRTNFASSDRAEQLTTILDDDETLVQAVRDAAEISMGTEVAEMDMLHISALAEQVLSMTEYRAQLYEYLRNRMNAIAPNLTILVGELVGARLISHAGSLLNLAKQPASTIQILGAEKALFRALKTKHDTPKYGLIYHASLIGQAPPKHKGKISRVLAAKSALAIRVDALSDDATADTTVGFEGRSKVEARLRQLEGAGGPGGGAKASSSTKHLASPRTARYDPIAAKAASVRETSGTYNPASDIFLSPANDDGDEKKKKRRKMSPGEEDDIDDENEATTAPKTPAADGSDRKKIKKEKKSAESKKDKKAAKKLEKKRKAEEMEDREEEDEDDSNNNERKSKKKDNNSGDDDDDHNVGTKKGNDEDDDDEAAAKKAARKAAKKVKKEKRKS